MAKKVKWTKNAMDGYDAEVIVSKDGVCFYNLHIDSYSDGTYGYSLTHGHIIKNNGLPLREEGKFAKTLEDAKQKCEAWMRKEIDKIRRDLHAWL